MIYLESPLVSAPFLAVSCLAWLKIALFMEGFLELTEFNESKITYPHNSYYSSSNLRTLYLFLLVKFHSKFEE